MSRWQTERLLLADDFAAWCASHPGARVEVFVGAERMHSLLVPQDLPLPDEAALLGYARLQFSHYFGAAAQGWPLASGTQGGARVVAAFAEADGLQTLLAQAAAHRVRIVSLRPTWTLAPLEDGDTVVVDREMLTAWQRRDGQLVALQQRLLGPEVMQEFSSARVLQASALLNEPVPRTGPDFIPQPSALRPLVWTWAAAAAAACLLVGMQAQGLAEEASRLSEQADVLRKLERPVPAKTTTVALGPAARARAWAAARQLGTDWAGRWTDLERALPPDLQLAGLDLDARALRLEGQSPAAEAVTQLVDRLALQAGPTEEVVLTRLQRGEGGGDLRFEIVRRTPATITGVAP